MLVSLALLKFRLDLNNSQKSSIYFTNWSSLILLRVNVMRRIIHVVKAGVLHCCFRLAEHIKVLAIYDCFLHVVNTLLSFREQIIGE